MNVLAHVARWMIPVALYDALKCSWLSSAGLRLRCRHVLKANRVLKGRCAGAERVFVLCNGPSVAQQNLALLQQENVISVSSGYLIKDFDVISPKYHCVPQITYGLMTEADVVKWFEEMDRRLGDAELFLSLSEYELVNKHGLFQGRKVHYLCLGRQFSDSETQLADLASVVPRVSSVPIMALMVAMYLGFKQIYLLGTEHDSFKTSKYAYAFEPTVLRGKDLNVTADGQVRPGALFTELQSYVALWRDYRSMKRIAEANGVRIVNATLGGALDEFERIEFHSLFD